MKSQAKKQIPVFERGSIEKFKSDYRLNLCLECGKCSAVCPMVNLYGRYDYGRSSRAIVERILFEPDKVGDEAFWFCLTCEECTFYCPSGVLFQSFMTDLRAYMLQRGHTRYAVTCPDCGGYLMPKKELEYLVNLESRKEIAALLSTCPRCKKKKYMEAIKRMAP
ncbi:MAG: 4Fe-4S dicluster domain-containing protein [Thermodesulfobacteriota bacterium]